MVQHQRGDVIGVNVGGDVGGVGVDLDTVGTAGVW